MIQMRPDGLVLQSVETPDNFLQMDVAGRREDLRVADFSALGAPHVEPPVESAVRSDEIDLRPPSGLAASRAAKGAGSDCFVSRFATNRAAMTKISIPARFGVGNQGPSLMQRQRPAIMSSDRIHVIALQEFLPGAAADSGPGRRKVMRSVKGCAEKLTGLRAG